MGDVAEALAQRRNRAFGNAGDFSRDKNIPLQYKYKSDIETKRGWISKNGKREEPVYTGNRRTGSGVYYGGRTGNNGPMAS